MRPLRLAGAVLAFALAGAPGVARATPLDFVPVGDPIEDELRILDVIGPGVSLPHLGMRPLQVTELPRLNGLAADPRAAIAVERLRRALARDRGEAPDSVGGMSRRMFQLAFPDDQRLEASGSLEGGGVTAGHAAPDFSPLSGVHLRFGFQTGGWIVHTHVLAGHVPNGLAFSEALFPGGDAVLHGEEAYLAYTADHARWAVRMGRSRWHWGPGDEGSLLLSRTSAAFTGMALHLRVDPLRADGTVLSATLDPAAGEQLAAHRLEWQPLDGLRVGLGEASRYRANRWEPLYWVGVLPYALVQNLLAQDQPDSGRTLHDNVEAALDAAWRIAPGRRVYAELMIDDLRTDDSPIVSKYAYQVGFEGVTMARGGRLTWGAEWTRLTRYVYTSYFGRSFVAQDRPLGFPTGPDSRRVRVRAAWDPSASWQAFGAIARTDVGESGLGVTFLPGSRLVNPARFLGVVEHTRDFELGLRYWPSSGVDVALSGGYRQVDGADHREGASRGAPRGELRILIAR